MAFPPVVCIKHEVYDKYDFLSAVPTEKRCIPPEDGRYCGLLAVQGPAGDGYIELHCNSPRKEPVAIITENGELYKGLTKSQLDDFYKGKLKLTPFKTYDVASTRSFFVKMFGGDEFTPVVKKEVCKEESDCPAPSNE